MGSQPGLPNSLSAAHLKRNRQRSQLPSPAAPAAVREGLPIKIPLPEWGHRPSAAKPVPLRQTDPHPSHASRKTTQLDLRLLGAALTAWAALVGGQTARLPVGFFLGWALAGLLVAFSWVGLSRRYLLHKKQIRRFLHFLALSFLGVSILFLAWATTLNRAQTGPLSELADRHGIAEMQAVLLTDARASHGSYGQCSVARAVITQVTTRGEQHQVHTPVLLLGPGKTGWRWQDRITFTGRVSSLDAPDMQAVVTATTSGEVGHPRGKILQKIEHVREKMTAAAHVLPTDPRGLLPALVHGDTAGIPLDLDAAMLLVGMSHLNAVSGSNVTIVITAVMTLGGFARLPQWARVLLAIGALIAFVALCRPQPSVLRAACMGLVGLFAVLGNRQSFGPSALGAAVMGVLVIWPEMASSSGFVLSVLATAGILLLSPRLTRWFMRMPHMPHLLAVALAVPAAAQIACLPVLTMLQGQISLVAWPANIVAEPFVAPATIGGIITAMLAAVHVPTGELAAYGAGLPAWAIAGIARLAAASPFQGVPWPDSMWGSLALAVLLGGLGGRRHWGAVLRIVRRWGRWALGRQTEWGRPAARGGQRSRQRPGLWSRRAIVGLGVMAPFLAWWWPLSRPPEPGWVCAMCDIGQGDAFVLQAADGGVVVIDCGPDPQRIDEQLHSLGVQKVHAVVLTHFHADHVDGLAGVLRGRGHPEVFITSLQEHGPERPAQMRGRGEDLRQATVLQTLKQAQIVSLPVRKGDVLRWPGITAHVVWPGPGAANLGGSIQNNSSVVLDVQLGGMRLLFTGDAEKEAQARLRENLQGQRIDVLKVSHHGSGNQDHQWIKELGAAHALISVGKGNDYGHPRSRTLRTLAQAGAQIWRTDQHGQVFVYPRQAGQEISVRAQHP